MKEIFAGLGVMSMLVVIVMIAVLIAMTIDCVSGWRKAKLRGDEHTSYAFSRSLTKFLIYEGMCIIGGCMDVMVHFAWWQFMESVYAVPLMTILIGFVLCIVEAWSVKEKADKKQRKQIETAVAILTKALGKEAVSEFIAEVLKTQMKAKAAAVVADDEIAMPSQHTELNEDNF